MTHMHVSHLFVIGWYKVVLIFGEKPLPKQMLANYEFVLQQLTSVKFEREYDTFYQNAFRNLVYKKAAMLFML